MCNEKYVIFGAGKWGKEALNKYGRKNVLYFIDNFISEKEVEHIPVVRLDHYKRDEHKPVIIIATMAWLDIVKQLKQNNLDNWIIYTPKFKSYFPEDVLVWNSYEHREECVSEEEYDKATGAQKRFLLVDSQVRELSQSKPLFNRIEIETYNRCNGVCNFCPVSVRWESRPEKKM